jgi:nuclease S1
MRVKVLLVAVTALCATSHTALSWGDDGHRAIALIAQHCLTAETRQKIAAILASDSDNLTKHDIASEATWADKYRQDHYQQTQNWHFTDIEN